MISEKARSAVIIDVEHLLAMGVVVRVGSADAWAATRRLLGVGVRIGTEQQLVRRPVCQSTHSMCPLHQSNGREDTA